MVTLHGNPYGSFNFLVEFDGQGVRAGFSEVSGLNTEVAVSEYRDGNAKSGHDLKLLGIHKTGNVTFKRGIIGVQYFHEWLEKCRVGNLKEAKRNLVIKLLSDDRKEMVLRWKLIGAMPIKWTGPTLNAKGGGEVAIEELVLAVEGLTLE